MTMQIVKYALPFYDGVGRAVQIDFPHPVSLLAEVR